MEPEAQRKGKGSQEEEITEEPKKNKPGRQNLQGWQHRNMHKMQTDTYQRPATVKGSHEYPQSSDTSLER